MSPYLAVPAHLREGSVGHGFLPGAGTSLSQHAPTLFAQKSSVPEEERSEAEGKQVSHRTPSVIFQISVLCLLNILFYEPFSSMSTRLPFGISGHNIAGRQPGHIYQLFKCTYYGSSNSTSRISSYSNLHVCAHNVYCSIVCNRKNNWGG